MQIVIDIDNQIFDKLTEYGEPLSAGNGFHDSILKAVANGTPYEEGSQGDLISRSYLRQMIPTPIEDEYKYVHQIINNAPSVETDIEVVAKGAYKQGYTDGWKERYGEPDKRPKGEWILNKDENPECPFCHHSFTYWGNFCGNCGADMRGAE